MATVDFGEEFAGDCADLMVRVALLAYFPLALEDWVDVQAAGSWTPGKLAEAEDELFLEIVGKIVLFAEVDYAALRDWMLLERGGTKNSESRFIYWSMPALRGACRSRRHS